MKMRKRRITFTFMMWNFSETHLVLIVRDMHIHRKV